MQRNPPHSLQQRHGFSSLADGHSIATVHSCCHGNSLHTQLEVQVPQTISQQQVQLIVEEEEDEGRLGEEGHELTVWALHT